MRVALVPEAKYSMLEAYETRHYSTTYEQKIKEHGKLPIDRFMYLYSSKVLWFLTSIASERAALAH